MNRHPNEFINKVLGHEQRPNPMKLLMQIQAEVQAGRIRPINPIQLVVNMISMCLFPFVAKPMFQGILQVNDEHYKQFMEMRKKEISDFIIHSIKVK